MTQIKCNVTTCSYHKGSDCCAGGISVGGKSAVSDKATCCGTFLSEDVYSNLAQYTEDRQESASVICQVHNCKYHQEDCCTLNEIQVGGNEAAKFYTETDCLSFEKRE